MKYAFLLGKNADLSITELNAFFGENLKTNKDCALAFVDEELPETPQRFLDRLGGCIAIIKILKENLALSGIQSEIENYLKKTCAEQTGKCNFAVNILPERKNSRALKFLLPNIKKNLRSAGLRPNFMNKNFQNASDVFAVKQGLIERRTWLAIIDIGNNKAALGFYVAMQNFDAYSKRDYGKPFRDPASGMLPPKLAQVMINLATNCHPELVPGFPLLICDPFCGSGTILMEALLAGHSAIGSDCNQKMAEGSAKNLEWLKMNFNISDKLSYKTSQKDATSIRKNDLPDSPFAIVTEPLLGPPLTDFPAEQFLEKVIGELSTLYLDFFGNLAAWIPANTPIVIIFPYWKNQKSGEKIFLSARIIDKILSLGYIKTNFDPLKSNSLFYDRPDQIVGREIVRLTKK